MTTPKTYYGPWMDELPEDASSGSLWQGLHKPDDRTHDFVVVGGELHHERDGLDAEWCQKFRRVYPPGSVLPEPRRMEGIDLSTSTWWMVGLKHYGRRMWQVGCGRDAIQGDIVYPVQRLANGAFVPIAWPDQCTEE